MQSILITDEMSQYIAQYHATLLEAGHHKAVRLARTLPALVDGVQGVELFGSRARAEETTTSDYNVIVLVGDRLAKGILREIDRVTQFVINHQVKVARLHYGTNAAKYVQETIELPGVHFYKGIRNAVIAKQLRIDADTIERWSGISANDLDLLVLPLNWRNQLDELQSQLPHDNPCFMRNLAKDAKPYSYIDGFDLPSHLHTF